VIVLDTDYMSLLEWMGKPETERPRARLRKYPETEVATTIIAYEEQVRGWMAYMAKARSLELQITGYRRLKAQLLNYSGRLILDFDEVAASIFQRLRRSRVRLGTKDLQIAAIGLAHDATLLTRNLRDFRKIEGLKVEDWTV
jgi:tRNA(fMet)-specific endonuclease VapC